MLEGKRRLLLVGESGTSKTTILMEILTDYFDEGYEILYNLDGPKIKNGPQLVTFIENRIHKGDKILVVVDDVHYERTSAIFYAMDVILSSFRYIQNIMFLLAARLPEYDSFVKELSVGLRFEFTTQT
jgi:predicted AAA+ superfamily ATPase